MSVFSLKHIESQPLQKESKNETMEWVFILEVEALVLKDKSIFYELHKWWTLPESESYLPVVYWSNSLKFFSVEINQ